MENKIENTYVLEPKEDERFCPSKVAAIIQKVLQDRLKSETYDPNNASSLTEELTKIIRLNCKTELTIPRYKLAIQVVLGEMKGQAVKICSKCLWDSNFDNFAQANFQNESLYAVGIVFGCYYE